MANRFTMVRVGPVLLSTLLKERGYEVKAFVEDIAPPDWSFIENSDIVCISTVTPTAPRAYIMASRIRSLGIPVVMGGVHPTFLPDESMLYSDFVIRGEGEFALIELIHALEKGRTKFSAIKGLSYKRKDGSIRHNPLGDLLAEEELNALPVPDFSLVHKWKSNILYPISTSRGCPFDCSFCSVIPMFGNRYRFKSIDSVLKELKHFQSVSKAVKFFVDDNFTANKKRSKELLKEMIVQGYTSRWSTQTSADVARDGELLDLMAKSGCGTLYIGFESINPETLKSYKKRHVPGDIVSCVKTIQAHGLHVHGMFVVGADTDDVDVIRRTAEFAIDCGIETAQIIPLTPMPGTPLFEEMKGNGRLLHTDWTKFNLQHVVFKPALMSPRVLQIETLQGMGRFYSWKYILTYLAKFNLHYTIMGFVGRRLVRSTLKEILPYIDAIQSSAPSMAF